MKFRRGKGSRVDRMDSEERPLEKKAGHKHPVAEEHKRPAVLRTVVRKKAGRTAAERIRQAGLDKVRLPAR